MANISLLPHNQEAYQKLMQHFASHDRAAVVHATGTGKSYIIASVVGHFYPSAIVIAPNNFVLEETKKICPPWVTFRTYASLMYDTEPSQYGIIVLDEFHRAGAEEWGKGVQRLIQANPTAKLLGTSATHIRYLDNARNMADELFDGNIVSSITIGDAINREILPNPTYVSSLYEINETLDIYTQRIRSVRIKDETKEELLTRMRIATRSWDQAYGVPNIIRKYYTKDMQRIIVFCSKVERSSHFRSLIAGWLSKAGYKHVRFYSIDYTEKRLESEMADFQAPMGNYDLKVAMSVNMLNEGVHIHHVDGIIMLRGTISRNIIEQQIGRCLTANAKHTPVILDLVNNMDTIRYDWQGFYAGDDESSQGSSSTEKKDTERFPFRVIDEMRDLRIFFNQIDKIIYGRRTKDECHEVALRYQLKSEFYKHDVAVYRYAYYHGWLDEITSHMPKTEINYYSREELRESVLSISELPKEKKYRSVLVNYIRNVVRQGEDSAVIEHVTNNNLYVPTREEKLEQYKSLLKEYVVKNNSFPRTHMKVDGKRIPEVTFYNYVLERCPQYIEELSSTYNIAKNGEVYDERFRQNVEFIRQVGYENLDYNIPKHDSMFGWILKQKHRWNRLKQWQRDELLSIGITPEIVTSTQKSIDKAKEYVAWVKEHGDFPPSNNQLYYWHKGVFHKKDINPDIIEILKEVGADNKYCKIHKIYSIDERVSILERWAKGEDVGYNIETLRSWKRKIYKSGDTALIERLENASIKVKSIGDALIDENLKELEELLKSGVKLLRKINGGIQSTVCKTICEGSEGDKRRQAFIDMLSSYGARVYTKEGEWWDNFNLCRSVMSRTGFYPRSRYQEERRCHKWLKNQVGSKYWEHLTPYLEKHNMLLPDESGVYQPNFAWSDPLPNEDYSHLGNKAW